MRWEFSDRIDFFFIDTLLLLGTVEQKFLFSNFEKRNFLICLFRLGSATPMSPTIRSPTMSGSPLGSAQNSDTENEPRSDGPTFNTSSPILRHRMAHKIQHKFVFVWSLLRCSLLIVCLTSCSQCLCVCVSIDRNGNTNSFLFFSGGVI